MVPRKNAPNTNKTVSGSVFLFERSDILNILLEYVLVFFLVFIVFHFVFGNNKKKSGKKRVTTELLYLKKIYGVDLKKEHHKKFFLICSLVNTFIISTIYIILIYLLENWILRVVLGIVLLILLIVICYGILGRYYQKKVGK